MRRRFNYTRSTLFPSINACVTATRELGIPSANKFNFVMRFLKFSAYAYTVGFFGLILLAYAQVYNESKPRKERWDLSRFEGLDFSRLEMILIPEVRVTASDGLVRPFNLSDVKIDVPFGPKTEQEAKQQAEKFAKMDLRGFTLDSEGYWSRPAGHWDDSLGCWVKRSDHSDQEKSPKP